MTGWPEPDLPAPGEPGDGGDGRFNHSDDQLDMDEPLDDQLDMDERLNMDMDERLNMDMDEPLDDQLQELLEEELEPDMGWPLDWRGLQPHERWLWFEQLWRDVLALRERYRLPVRSGWWEDWVQVEALAALAAWVRHYDHGEWDDPPGKLALLYDLERVGALLRDGSDPFHPERDRPAFVARLLLLGCRPPP